jgi:hypothetical protein
MGSITDCYTVSNLEAFSYCWQPPCSHKFQFCRCNLQQWMATALTTNFTKPNKLKFSGIQATGCATHWHWWSILSYHHYHYGLTRGKNLNTPPPPTQPTNLHTKFSITFVLNVLNRCAHTRTLTHDHTHTHAHTHEHTCASMHNTQLTSEQLPPGESFISHMNKWHMHMINDIRINEM